MMIQSQSTNAAPSDILPRMRHSAAHVMADAVRRFRPNAKVAIGPAIDDGFYYDFETEPGSSRQEPGPANNCPQCQSTR
jgi:threonyl-tRNA synthetase